MYRRPKFLQRLLEIRREMAHEADYDVDLFVELVRKEERARGAVVPGEFYSPAESLSVEPTIEPTPERPRKVRNDA
jgi:hypothetical protein